jgi:hypothetical protein
MAGFESRFAALETRLRPACSARAAGGPRIGSFGGIPGVYREDLPKLNQALIKSGLPTFPKVEQINL